MRYGSDARSAGHEYRDSEQVIVRGCLARGPLEVGDSQADGAEGAGCPGNGPAKKEAHVQECGYEHAAAAIVGEDRRTGKPIAKGPVTEHVQRRARWNRATIRRRDGIRGAE